MSHGVTARKWKIRCSVIAFFLLMASQSIASAQLVCEYDGNVDPVFVDGINEKLKLVPESVSRTLSEEGWHVCCTDKDIDSCFFDGMYGRVKGMTDYDTCIIYIEDREEAVETAVLHEIGHAWDHHLGSVTSSQEYMDIFYRENDAFCSTFLIDFHYDETEMYAEAFDKYITQTEQLRTNCPMVYEYIDSSIRVE